MLGKSNPDSRIANRANTIIWRWGKHSNTARILARLLLRPPDVYFFPREGPLDAGFLAVRTKFRLRSALVTYVVTGGLTQDSLHPTLRRAIHESDAIAGNSRRMAGTVSELGGSNVHVVYDGIDRRYYYSRAESRGEHERKCVLFAGSFRGYKRAELVIEQAARHPQWDFRLAGKGEEEDACRQLAQNKNCRNVRFLGHLSAAQLGEEMRRVTLFFFPSELEGHPQVLGQAAACGLPCVARRSYHPDYIVDGASGLLANSDEELTSTLGRLIADGELRRRMSAAAVRHAQTFEWDEITRQWEQIFEQAVIARKHELAKACLAKA
jgi:glycosyltransferase involved in cell wall biosynthesis